MFSLKATQVALNDYQKMQESANHISESGQLIIHFEHGKSVANKRWENKTINIHNKTAVYVKDIMIECN